ncbi:3-deoxy-manno-octulosonate cytidylyltransferase [Holospora obtusa F1]|uniref:3-deoxy-manno-octulosonate cytidylyltransferase n=1 Tax=Holospora obtusa F1 TaxID=1399147 RepID=W6TEQ4_HOLOB|nr:hypothetical protein [Holospora obtusa]ETZ07334.1 3-deoxy-manno-octulosonate cytidylyltransferase [Holospora obtusa F1]
MRTLIVIPARLKSKRFPEKSLAQIQGIPMIQRVFNNLQNSHIAPVWVAYDDDRIGNLFSESQRVKTGECFTGTDRVAQAIDIKNAWNQFDIVINVQGDTPVIDTQILFELLVPFSFSHVSMVTIVSELEDQKLLSSPSKVKAVCSKCPDFPEYWKCHDFSRVVETLDSSFSYFSHWGVYAFRTSALKSFTTYAPSFREQSLALEQLRFLDQGHSIWAIKAPKNMTYMCVDTQEDLKAVQIFLENR